MGGGGRGVWGWRWGGGGGGGGPGRDVRVGVFTDIRRIASSRPLPAMGGLPRGRVKERRNRWGRKVRREGGEGGGGGGTPPAHGSVTVKRGTLKATNIKQCLAIDVPAFVAFYRAAADYSGADDFELEISSPNGHKRRERVHVTVAKSSSAGEGI